MCTGEFFVLKERPEQKKIGVLVLRKFYNKEIR